MPEPVRATCLNLTRWSNHQRRARHMTGFVVSGPPQFQQHCLWQTPCQRPSHCQRQCSCAAAALQSVMQPFSSLLQSQICTIRLRRCMGSCRGFTRMEFTCGHSRYSGLAVRCHGHGRSLLSALSVRLSATLSYRLLMDGWLKWYCRGGRPVVGSLPGWDEWTVWDLNDGGYLIAR